MLSVFLSTPQFKKCLFWWRLFYCTFTVHQWQIKFSFKTISNIGQRPIYKYMRLRYLILHLPNIKVLKIHRRDEQRFKATYFTNLCHSTQNLHVLQKISVCILMLYVWWTVWRKLVPTVSTPSLLIDDKYIKLCAID